jgi:hypothetical protein
MLECGRLSELVPDEKWVNIIFEYEYPREAEKIDHSDFPRNRQERRRGRFYQKESWKKGQRK